MVVIDLGECGALRPDGAVVAGDGRGREVVALDLAHQVLVHVRLPRHLLRPAADPDRTGRSLKDDGRRGRSPEGSRTSSPQVFVR